MMMKPFESLWRNAHLITMPAAGGYGVIEDGAIAVRDGRIAWLGPERELAAATEAASRQVHDLNGAWVTPGLIDCHTHLVYAGSRAAEFEMRLGGATYEEIARAGGGILQTVRAVRVASEEALYEQAAGRLRDMQAEGVTTVEVKSGYGLTTESELKMLRVARRLAEAGGAAVIPTFLGAHALPPEFRGRPDDYVDLVAEEMLPAVAGERLAEAVDVFCEKIGFSPRQTERIFKTALDLGFKIKLHAEQLSDQKGAVLAARYGALSADHLEYLNDDGVEALAGSGTVAVLLPGAFFFLNETKKPPVAKMREKGIPMALSTDCNPGSSPTTSPLLMMNMGCILFGLTPQEALAGFTVNAALALGLQDRAGSLATGKAADFAVWRIAEPAELAYRMGGNPCEMTVKEGSIIFQSKMIDDLLDSKSSDDGRKGQGS